MPAENYWISDRRWSRRAVVRGAGAAGLGLAGAALIGCGDDDDPPPPATASPPPSTGGTPGGATPTPDSGGADGPRAGGTFGRATTSPSANFNPVKNWQEANFGSGANVYDRLLVSRMDDPGYILEAAESLEVVDDTTIVFKLKEGMVYQDRAPVNGRVVDTEDIVTMQDYVRQEEAAQDASFVRNFLDHAEATDDRTVVYHLQHPSAYLFSGTQLGHAVSQAIVPRELTLGDFDQSEPIGSGPYQITSAQLQVRYEYERNPTFREAERGLPYIDKRIWLPIATDAAADEAAFRSGQSMVIQPLDPAMSDRLVDDLSDEIEVLEFTSLITNWRNMSRARATFDDIRVREAFYRWYDPEPYITLTADGWGEDPPGQLSAGLSAYQLDRSETEEYKRFDLEASRQLLDAAGFDFNQTYEITTTTSGVNQTNAQIMEQELAKAGITNVTFKIFPFPEWAPNIANTGNYDFSVVFYAALDTPATPIRLHHSEPNNINSWVGIRDPEIDVLIEESERITDREAQIEKVKDVQRALLQKYSHMGMIYTPVIRELRWSYLRDWDQSTSHAYPVHINYQTQAWLDV